MKITKSELREIIREEIQKLNEGLITESVGLLKEGLAKPLFSVKIPIKGETKTETIEFSVLTPAMALPVPLKSVQLIPKKETQLIELFPNAASVRAYAPMLGVEDVVYPQIVEYAKKKLAVDVQPQQYTKAKGFLINIDVQSIINKLK